MSLNNIYFILVRPQMGENIGSVARAMKNFNIKYLRIINPRCNWPNQKALSTSVGAKDILKSAKIYDSLEKSIEDQKNKELAEKQKKEEKESAEKQKKDKKENKRQALKKEIIKSNRTFDKIYLATFSFAISFALFLSLNISHSHRF